MSSLPHTLVAFVFVISVIVFIHEFGHYIIAKACGVRITTFSLGFGKELFGWNDKSGTRWKVSLLPLGGYVKMFGDSSEASNPDVSALETMSNEDKKHTFHFKPLYQKALIVAAGPFFNFLLTIGIFTYFILSNGLPSTEPVVGKVIEKSVAEEAGLKIGDRINMVNDRKIHSFNDISYYISTNLGTPVVLNIKREQENLQITLTPKDVESVDDLGNKILRPLIGIGSQKIEYNEVGLLGAMQEATMMTYMVCEINLRTIGQLIIGERSTKDLRGTLGVAQISGQAASKGFNTLMLIIAHLSAGIGLMNLLPIPVLDGGHLVFYTIEAVFRRPLAVKAQEWSFRIGFALIAMLMAYTFMNDVRRMVS